MPLPGCQRMSKTPWPSGYSWSLLRKKDGTEHFAETQGALSSLAREALDEHERDETEELNSGSL